MTVSRLILAACLLVTSFTSPVFPQEPLSLDAPYPGWILDSISSKTVTDKFEELGVPKVPRSNGVIVMQITGWALQSELNRGDVIISLNGEPIEDNEESLSRLRNIPIGEHKVGYLRVEVKGKKRSWKKQSTEITVTSYFEFLERSFKVETDEFTKVTSLKHKLSPDTSSAYSTTASPVILVNEKGVISPVFLFQLSASDWIFARSVSVLVDGETTKVEPSQCDFKRDVIRGGRVQEWTFVYGDTAKDLFKKIENAKSVSVRFHGTTYSRDYELKPDEVHLSNITATAYKALSSKSEKKPLGITGSF